VKATGRKSGGGFGELGLSLAKVAQRLLDHGKTKFRYAQSPGGHPPGVYFMLEAGMIAGVSKKILNSLKGERLREGKTKKVSSHARQFFRVKKSCVVMGWNGGPPAERGQQGTPELVHRVKPA